MNMDEAARRYVVAGLRLGQDVEGFVDSYYGPEELRTEARQILNIGRALDDLDSTLVALPATARRDWLTFQARAMRVVARVQAGDALSYSDQVRAYYDIEPTWTDEKLFDEAHATLDALLPGDGSLVERRAAYRKQFVIPRERILPLAESLTVDLRERTGRLVELPEGEDAELQLVSNQPWSGYNWYLGGLRSRVEVNTDLPVYANALPDLLAHELYPGHHTEHSLKEHHLFRIHGYGDVTIALLTSPQAVVSEGIATMAFSSVVADTERADWLREHTFNPLGIAADVERDLRIAAAGEALRKVAGNAALLLHERQASVEQVVAYLSRYSLQGRHEAEHRIRFLAHPLYGTYVFSYPVGHDLVEAYLARAPNRQAALRSLLTEYWTPTRLRGK
jgi:hypothetical protein